MSRRFASAPSEALLDELGVSFQSYLSDRNCGSGEILQLSERMRSTATTAPIGREKADHQLIEQ